MKKIVIIGFFILLLLAPIVQGQSWEEYHFYEKDGKGDVINLSLEKWEVRIGRQLSDIDISNVEVRYYNGSIDFKLTVYGNIKNDEWHTYSFDVYRLENIERDLWFFLQFGDDNSTIIFYDNYTKIDLLAHTNIDDGTLTISVDVSLMGEYCDIDIIGSAMENDLADLNLYMDSTEPVEEGLKRQPGMWIVILIVLVVVLIIGIVLFVVFGKKWRMEFKFKFKKKCPNCGIIFSRRMKKCTYCNTDLNGTLGIKKG